MSLDASKLPSDDLDAQLAAAEVRTPLLMQWVDTGIKPEGLK